MGSPAIRERGSDRTGARWARVAGAGMLALAVGLALLATWAVVTAPSGATVTVSGKRGRGHAEVGLWILNVATLVLGLLGSCCVARPQAMNGTKARMAMGVHGHRRHRLRGDHGR